MEYVIGVTESIHQENCFGRRRLLIHDAMTTSVVIRKNGHSPWNRVFPTPFVTDDVTQCWQNLDIVTIVNPAYRTYLCSLFVSTKRRTNLDLFEVIARVYDCQARLKGKTFRKCSSRLEGIVALRDVHPTSHHDNEARNFDHAPSKRVWRFLCWLPHRNQN